MNSGTHTLQIKVRYAETDAMGFVHHSNYYTYFEAARIEAFEDLNCPYQEMEKNGILIPVLASKAEYKKPVYFGDILTLHTSKFRRGATRIIFRYKVFVEDTLMATGETTHAFINPKGRPIRPPSHIIGHFAPEPPSIVKQQH